MARPVGAGVSDHQGVVVLAGSVSWDARELLRGCGVRAFAFDHLLASQPGFRPYVRFVEPSPVLDLDRPWSASGQADRKLRRLARRAELRLELHERGDAAFRTLLGWKSEQYRRTGAFDVLRRPWVAALLELLHATRTEALEGALACLYADERLVAAHFGLRSGRVLHWWFPAYDPEFARESPGTVLLRMLIDAAPADGIGLLDFGKGAEPYKTAFANGAIDVAAGHVETGFVSTLRAGVARVAWRRLLDSRFRRPARAVRKRLDFR